MNKRIQIEIQNHVANVRMCRPDKSNALDGEMFDGLIEAGERLKTMKAVRAVVLSGEGRGFCAGIDMAVLADMENGAIAGTRDLVFRTHGACNRFQYAAWVWREVPVPVIAAIHGFALGGGLELSLGADIRYVSPDARLSVMEVRWGLVPDMGGTQLMRELARADIIKELSYTGRLFSGAEAVTYGLATRTATAPHEAAMEVASAIAANSPDSVRALKRIYNADLTAETRAGLIAETVEQQALVGSYNQMETVHADREKRVARFRD